MTSIERFTRCCGFFAFFIFLLDFSLTTGSKHDKCDVTKCLSPQLMDATKSRDSKTLCRLLSPALHCMEVELPVCRETLHGDNEHMYDMFVNQLNILQRQYANKCHKIATTCQGFSKCLHPTLQQAHQENNVEFLCKNSPTAISCFEVALAKCEREIGYKDANMEMMQSFLDNLRRRTSATCDSSSITFGTTKLALVVLVIQALLYLFGRHYGSSR